MSLKSIIPDRHKQIIIIRAACRPPITAMLFIDIFLANGVGIHNMPVKPAPAFFTSSFLSLPLINIRRQKCTLCPYFTVFFKIRKPLGCIPVRKSFKLRGFSIRNLLFGSKIFCSIGMKNQYLFQNMPEDNNKKAARIYFRTAPKFFIPCHSQACGKSLLCGFNVGCILAAKGLCCLLS